MSLDNGAADRYPDSHSIAFRCKERFEELVRGLRGETDSRIFHAKAHPIPLIAFGFDQQFSWAIFDSAHRIRSIPQQIQNDLLKLDTIADDGREVIRKLMTQNYTLAL